MGLGSTEEGNFVKTQKAIPDEGQHLSKCFQIIDLGTHMESFKGADPKPVAKIQLGFEIPKFRGDFKYMKDGQEVVENKVLAVFQSYTNSLGTKANFRKMMDSWTGQEVKKLTYESLKQFLGKPAMIQIVHARDKNDVNITYANIANRGIGIYKRPKDVAFTKGTENPLVCLDLDNFSWEEFDKIPKFLQEKIEKSIEWPSILSNHPKPGAVADASVQSGVIESTPDSFEDEEEEMSFD
jgi:hypothetical protein